MVEDRLAALAPCKPPQKVILFIKVMKGVEDVCLLLHLVQQCESE